MRATSAPEALDVQLWEASKLAEYYERQASIPAPHRPLDDADARAARGLRQHIAFWQNPEA